MYLFSFLKFSKVNFFSLLLALMPISFIAGNMIININSDYGKYFQFGLRNEEKINTGLQSNPYYSEFNDNQNVKIYVVDNFKIIPIN